MKPILEIQNISKKYRIHHLAGGYLSLRERIGSRFKLQRNQTEDFLALNNVSFRVLPGESIGIIGRNGTGKSTLLKILSKITPPTSGRIISRGRVASLLEVGTGFHPELTGRENIFFNGSLLGMRRREIESKFDEIVDFSGVERFLDTPLKHYSSGMQLRLAFAVAAFLEPEILIIDEVLAVGDAEFQKKCMGKMEDVSKSGRTILFVSHNMAAVENLCKRGILLNAGTIIADGDVRQVMKSYQGLFDRSAGSTHKSSGSRMEPVYFKTIELTLNGSQPNYQLRLKCEICSQEKHKDVFFAFDISNSIGVPIMQAIPVLEPFISHSVENQVVWVEIDLPPMIPDIYKLSAWIGSHNTDTISWDKEIASFEIVDSPTKGRNFPHSHNNGFLVPPSRIIHG